MYQYKDNIFLVWDSHYKNKTVSWQSHHFNQYSNIFLYFQMGPAFSVKIYSCHYMISNYKDKIQPSILIFILNQPTVAFMCSSLCVQCVSWWCSHWAIVCQPIVSWFTTAWIVPLIGQHWSLQGGEGQLKYGLYGDWDHVFLLCQKLLHMLCGLKTNKYLVLFKKCHLTCHLCRKWSYTALLRSLLNKNLKQSIHWLPKTSLLEVELE